MDVTLISVLGALLLASGGGDCREPDAMDHFLGGVAQSLYYTTQRQVEPWVHYEGGIWVWDEEQGWEGRVAMGDGDKQAFDNYIASKIALDRGLLLCLPEPLGRLVIGAKVIPQALWAAQDNEFRERIGHSPFWGISYGWAF